MNPKNLKKELIEQKQELELEKSKLKTIIETIPDLLWLKDKDGKYITCNKRFENFFGAKEKDIIGKTDYDFVNKELADFFREHDKNAMQSSIPLVNNEEVTFAVDGHKEFLNTTKVKVHGKDGQVIGVLGIGRDITEIRNKQKRIEKEKLKYEKLMENSSDAIFIVNLEGYIVDFSKEFARILGYEKKEIFNLHISDYEAIHTKEQIKENIKKTAYEPLEFNSIYRRKDCSLFDVSIRAVRVKIEEKDYLYCSFRDISEEIKLQNSLRKQKEEFETIFNYSHDGIAITDLNANFLNFNNAFLDLTGFTRPELLKMNCNELTAPEDRSINEKMLQTAIKYCHTENFEKDCIMKGNIRKSVNISMSLLPDSKRILLTIKDISSLKHMEQNTKLASMGEMIGNIAHQWRQPLNVITTYVTGLKLKSEFGAISNEDIIECTDNVKKQAEYLSQTIDNFRNFLKGEEESREIRLCEIIDESLNLVSASMKNNYIKVIKNIDEESQVYANKSELSEAFINILNNSKDALKSNIKDENDRLVFIESTKTDDCIEIYFYDSANGIDESILDKVFNPYFTTKHQSQGTGLGLSITEKIIRERLNGEISVYNHHFEYENKKYKGACFKIVLKLA